MQWPDQSGPALPAGPIRLLSFNIQAGIRTDRFREYLTRGWRQLVHDEDRQTNLRRIGRALGDHDLVALQEVDAGSLRSGFVNQVAYLAHLGGHRYWYAQRNRRLGRFAQHGNGLLSRFAPVAIEDHPLPSAIPGRGAIFAEFDLGPGDPLLVVVVHLSLGARARRSQLAYLADYLGGRGRVILMGDMNAAPKLLLGPRSPLHGAGLRAAHDGAPVATWPSWRPRQALDHVLVSADIEVHQASVLALPYSDHLPVAVELTVKAGND